jgi:hypothetical protein
MTLEEKLAYLDYLEKRAERRDRVLYVLIWGGIAAAALLWLVLQ